MMPNKGPSYNMSQYNTYNDAYYMTETTLTIGQWLTSNYSHH